MRTVQQDNQRIAQLPVMPRPTEEWAVEYSKHVTLASAPLNPDGSSFTLKLEQAWALASYQQYGGFFAPIPVGGGKTLISLCVPHIGFKFRGHKKAMLLIPPSLGDQLIQRDLPWVRERMPLGYNWYSLVGKSKAARTKIVSKDRPGLYIVPYTALSNLDGLEVMRGISPTLVIADEAHTLANDSARSKRYWGVLQEIEQAQGRSVEFCALSGTMAKKRLKDFWKLMRQAMGENAPLPLNTQNLDEWDETMAADGSNYITPACSWLPPWAENQFPDERFTRDTVGARSAFQARLKTAPGVITGGDASCKADLKLGHFEVPDDPAAKGWDELQQMKQNLETLGMKPNGELVSTPMHIYNISAELSCGFYNDPFWPEAEVVSRRKEISVTEAENLLDRSKRYLEADQTYRSVLFPWVRSSPLGFDSDLQVGQKIANGETQGIDPAVVQGWHERSQADFEQRIERDHRYVMVCDWKLDAVVTRVKRVVKERKTGTLVWAHNHAVVDRLIEKLEGTGFETYGVSPRHPKKNMDLLYDKSYRNCVFVLSLGRCAHGLNLQHTFHTNVYAQVVRSAAYFEQSLGRTHRQGQEAEEVYAEVVLTEGTDHDTLGACLVEATFTHQVLGNDHKAILAAWDPPPRLPPPEMLRSKVPNVESLAPSVAREYLRRFGCA